MLDYSNYQIVRVCRHYIHGFAGYDVRIILRKSLGMSQALLSRCDLLTDSPNSPFEELKVICQTTASTVGKETGAKNSRALL